MSDILNTKHLPVVLLALLALIALWSLVRLSRSQFSHIKLDDLLLGEDGTMSRAACVLMGSFAVSTWGMVYMWLNEKMTEGYFIAYLGVWATPAVTKLVTGSVERIKALPTQPPAPTPGSGS